MRKETVHERGIQSISTAHSYNVERVGEYRPKKSGTLISEILGPGEDAKGRNTAIENFAIEKAALDMVAKGHTTDERKRNQPAKTSTLAPTSSAPCHSHLFCRVTFDFAAHPSKSNTLERA